MNHKEAIELLKRHNEWRKGAEIEPTNPTQLGMAIDIITNNNEPMTSSRFIDKWLGSQKSVYTMENVEEMRDDLYAFAEGYTKSGSETQTKQEVQSATDCSQLNQDKPDEGDTKHQPYTNDVPPCPYCGGDATIFAEHYANCDKCQFSLHLDIWNKRACYSKQEVIDLLPSTDDVSYKFKHYRSAIMFVKKEMLRRLG